MLTNGRRRFGKAKRMTSRLPRSSTIAVPTNHSLFGTKDSLFPQEQGIGCKLLNALGNLLPKPP
jgi:hypothetical protein